MEVEAREGSAQMIEPAAVAARRVLCKVQSHARTGDWHVAVAGVVVGSLWWGGRKRMWPSQLVTARMEDVGANRTRDIARIWEKIEHGYLIDAIDFVGRGKTYLHSISFVM